MTQRLPIPGSDDGTWGDILNGFLAVSLNADGTIQTAALTQAGGEVTGNKGIASGYAGLNSSGLVPTTQLATGTASSSNYLRGDGTWVTPNGGSSSLASDSDVAIVSPANNQVLTYNSSSGKWINQVAPSAPVSSVFGRTGAVVATTGDYTAAQVTGAMSTSVYDAAGIDQQVVGTTATQTLTNKTLTSPTLTTPALGTPASGVATNLTGTAAGLTAGSATTATTATTANGINSATTTVVTNGATAPSTNQVLTATSSTAANWQTPSGAPLASPAFTGTPTVNGQSIVLQVAAPTGVAATDTTAIQNAINTTSSVGSAPLGSGGVTVVLQAGTYVVNGLTMLSQVRLLGQGEDATVIQLAAGANVPVVISQNFSSLTGTDSNAGIYTYTFEKLTIDGNSSNQTAITTTAAQTGTGAGICCYGYQPRFYNIEVRNCVGLGIYNEWGNTNNVSSITLFNGSMEGRTRGLKLNRNLGGGVVWFGPSDSQWDEVEVMQNGPVQVTTTIASGSTGGNIANIASWSSPSAGVLDVASSSSFATSGTATVVTSETSAVIAWTGKGTGTLTGCTLVSGAGTVSTGAQVTNTGTIGVWIGEYAFGTQISNMHIWGQNHSFGLRADVSIFTQNLEIEGASTSQLWIRSNGSVFIGGELFEPGTDGAGFRIGDTSASVGAGDNAFYGTRLNGAGMLFDKDAGANSFYLHVYLTSGTVFNGTPNYSKANTYKIDLNGGATMGTLYGGSGAALPQVLATNLPRVLDLSSNSATPTFCTDDYDVVNVTAQTATITSMSSGVTGNPADGSRLRVSITGTGSVGITWGSLFESSTITLPTTTSSTSRLDMGFFWNSATSKWRCVGVA